MAASVPLLTSRTLSQSGHPGADLLCELDLAWGRCPKRRPLAGSAPYRLDDLGVGVAQDGGAVGLDVVDVAVALDIGHVRPFAAHNEVRCPANGLERPHRRVDPSGCHATSALEERLVSFVSLTSVPLISVPLISVPLISVGSRPQAPRSSATSPAKYVSTKSAPARLMAPSCSSATALPSSQPRSAAALTMAYSPLTW